MSTTIRLRSGAVIGVEVVTHEGMTTAEIDIMGVGSEQWRPILSIDRRAALALAMALIEECAGSLDPEPGDEG